MLAMKIDAIISWSGRRQTNRRNLIRDRHTTARISLQERKLATRGGDTLPDRTTRTVNGQVKMMQVQHQVKNFATVRAQFIFSNFEFLMIITLIII